ncbi:MAG TPA: SDR family oxidoreductase [Devosia sp.]|jgi:NAD(P)-dependent dehydrogenase (short-subunit alcohol dehydrogenase family)|nr:SDR family oxidoreductase [Devosia sp.]
MTGALIVTGASRGIGAATAILAAHRGWSVVVNYSTSPAAATQVVETITAGGGRALAFQADVAVEAEVVALFDFAEAKFGAIKGLVNNAGILRPAARFADLDLARWNGIIATNATGAFLCAREAARRMPRSRGGEGGAIVNVSSMAAVLGAPGEFIDYAASKGAVDTLTVGLAKELAADGVRVNGVRPGLIDTDIQAQSGDPLRASRLAGSVPMQRVGTVEEVAEAILWLLSPSSSYVTGTITNVSGGR